MACWYFSNKPKISSRFLALMDFSTIYDVSIFFNWNFIRVMKPVSPIPPILMSNNSSFWERLQVSVSPSAVIMSKSITCLPKAPSLWWFFPCTSEPIAPPTVMYFVPGVTGRNQPFGTITLSTSSRVTPGWHSIMPCLLSKSRIFLSFLLEINLYPNEASP